MKNILLLLISLFAFSAVINAQNEVKLMPWPKSLEKGQEKLIIEKNFSISVKGEADEFLYARADDFLRRIAQRTGIFIQQERIRPGMIDSENPTMTIQVREKGTLSVSMDESYSIDINQKQVILKAETSYGALRGLATLLQWLETDEEVYYFPQVKIIDQPRFPWRGLLLDPARHWLPVEVIKRNIDGMAAVKMNVLHLHLTDDQGFRIESKVYPKLHQLGGEGLFYTQEQMKDIIRYAADRGIRIVPEFDMPGHATSWLVGYPELATVPGEYKVEREWGIMNPVMDPTKESTYTFLDAFLSEMCSLFTDDYIHIGGDENNGKHWNESEHIQAYMKANNIKDNHELQAYFNQRILAILSRNNKQMVGWDEIQHPQMPRNVVIQSWRGPKGLEAAAKAGYPVMLSNGYYIDLIQTAEFHYLNDPLPEGHNLSPDEAKLVMGGEATMWGEQVTHETIDGRIWPRTAAIAERLWSPSNIRDIKSMYERMDIISLQLEEAGLTHEKNYEMMLRRLCRGNGVEELRILADISEPVKIYKRNAISDVNALMPYTRFVDATRPDAGTARTFNESVDKILNGDTATSVEYVESMLIKWYANNQNLEITLNENPVLHEIIPLAKNLKVIAFAGLQALNYLKENAKADSAWYDYSVKLCDEARKPYGETELMVVSGILKLIESTQ